MKQNKELNFLYIKTESDNFYHIFIEYEEHYFKSDIEALINEQKQLTLETSEFKMISKPLPEELFLSLTTQGNKIFFTNEKGQPIAYVNLPPFQNIN